MWFENLIAKFDNTATVVVGIVVIKMLIDYFKNKLNNEANKEENINSILTKQLETLVDNSTNYKNDIDDLKKIILNKANMSITDLQTFLKNLNQSIHYKLLFDIFEIVDKNNIVDKTLQITLQKINNSIEQIFSLAIYDVYSLSFDRTTLEEIIRVFKIEQKSLKEKFEEVINTYIENSKDLNMTHEQNVSDSKKVIKEILNYLSNDMSSNVYSVLNGLNLCECS